MKVDHSFRAVRNSGVARIVCVAVVAIVAATAGADSPSVGKPFLPPISTMVPEVTAALSLSDVSIQTPAFEEDESGVLRTSVLIDGEVWTLELRKHSNRADDFKLVVQDETGEWVETTPPPVHTYRGFVVEYPDIQVRASYVDGGLTATIHAEDEMFGIEPVASLGIAAPNNEHAVYHAGDWMNIHGYRCGVTDETAHGEFEATDDAIGGTAGTGLKKMDLAVEADFEFFQKNGSNVNNTLIDMENVINSMEAIYETSPTLITYEITRAAVDSVSPSDYSSSDAGTRLCEFRTRWNTSPQTNAQRDLAHLFTGKVINGATIGIAWLGVVCNASGNDCSGVGNLAYGMVESRFSGASFTERVALSAHEIGHNWDATHCDGCGSCASCCRIMCSVINSCSGILNSFGCVSEGEIVAFKNTRGCLSDLLDPQALPFSDNFETGTLQPAKWSYNFNSATSTNATNEPSGNNSANLDANGSGLYLDDDLRTNFILLGGQTTGSVSYYTEHVGVENGEEFVVEYFGTNLLWNELNRITSDGVNQTSFEFHSHALPINAFHNEFRLRFRPEVDESNDEWYVDDVSVTSATVATITQDPVSQSVCQSTAAGFSVTAIGDPPLTYQWKKNGNNIIGATSSTYIIGSANVSDAGAYSCVVTNGLGSDESAAAVLTVITSASCNDGLFCNGVETCVAGACVDNADPCAEACKESTDTCQPYGTMACDLLSTGAVAGGSATMELTLSQVLELAGYEAKITITRTSGTGTVSVGCPDGVEINDTDPSYVFSGQTSFFSTDCANARLASAIFATVDVPVSPRYLGTYTLDVSLDASVGSTFEISLSALPDDTFIRSGFEAPIPFNIGAPCELTVVACAVYGDVKPPLDGAVTIDDILCVLNGFGNFSTCPLGDIAPCFGNGIINLDDILAVLSAFAGNDPCCGGGGGAGSPGGPAPIITPHIGTRPTKAGRQTGNERNAGTELQLVPRAEKVASGDTVVVDVFAESVTDLRGYELRVETRADREGLVSLVGASVDEKHPDFAFAGRTSFPAIDVAGGRLACAAMEGAVSSRGRTYLGSFTFQTGAVKGGTFSVGLSSAQGAELRDSQSAPLGVVWPPVAVITVAN